MKSQPKLIRIITPPPIGPSSVLASENLESMTHKALMLHLAKSVPTSFPRTSPFKLQLITVHPSQPFVAYLLIPDGTHDQKKMLPKSVVVQHIKTRTVIWSMSLGEMASIIHDIDVLDNNAEQRQHKLVKELGQVQGLDFFDPSTLYWSGNGSVPASTDNKTERWSYLMVQFTNRVLIVNLRKHSISVLPPSKQQQAKSSSSAANGKSTFRPIVANISQELLSGVMSSNVVPVTRTTLLVGTTDGMIKLYDWTKEVVIQSIKIVHAKHDAIVHILPTNKYGTPEYYATAKRKIACLTKKGAALLLELSVTEGIVHDISQPTARLEGGAVPTSVAKHDDDHSSIEHIFVQYCGFRDLLMWTFPAKNAKGKLLVWDIGSIPEPDAKQKKKNEPPKPEPTLVMQFPYETSHTVFPGWFHEAIPMESMACAAVTKEGEFQIIVAPLYNSGSTVKNPYTAVPILSVNLAHVIIRDMDLGEDRELHIKVQSCYCPALRDSSTFYIGTNIGVVMIKLEESNLVPIPGGRHAHLSANIGGMGKSILAVKGPEISYAALEPGGGPLVVNPIGRMENKNVRVVYESPPPLHLPPEIHKRPVRLPPCFLMSPSRTYLCCFWKEEMRYEILHIQSMLDRVTSRTNVASGQSVVVSSGNGVASIAWVGDDDVYALLYNPEQDLALKVGIDLSAPSASMSLANAASKVTDLSKLRDLTRLREMAKISKDGAKAVAGTAGKLKSLEGLRDATTGTMKGIGKVGLGTVKLTGKVALGTVKGTMKGTTKVTKKMAVSTAKVGVGGAKLAVGGTSMAVGGAAKMTKFAAKRATFGFMSKKQKNSKDPSSLANADQDGEDEGGALTATTPLDIKMNAPATSDNRLASEQLERKYPWVELRVLVGRTGADGNVNSATSSNLGELQLRSGNRNPASVLFGGPVLCVGSKLDESDEGLAYFYALKKGSEENSSAADFVSSGPAFPCPDLVAWDEDGRLCAVVLHSRVSIYLSDEPNFIMLGTARLGSSADQDVQVTSVRFIHGVLYCTTRSSVQCIFLGDLDGGVCHLDMFTLASSEVATLPSKTIVSDYNSLTPPTIPMPLNYPIVLGYQNGSLILSTVSGIQALPLGFPLLRIGALIGAGHHQKAEKWFDAVPQSDHEALATFLDRRGVPELALQLSGVSLETTIDLCMRYGYIDRLEEIVDIFGLNGLRAIDMGRGFASSVFGPEEHGMSVVVCVGAYMLSQGKVELVRRLATECLVAGEDGKQDALMLASLLLSVEGSDSKRVIHRAVEDVEADSDWLVGSFVKQHIL